MELWPIIGGIFLGWALGSNDAANIFGSGVATNLIKFRTAVILIAIFVVAGAVLEGSKVMAAVGHLSQLIPLTAFLSTLAAGIVVTIMSARGLPVSTSQAIVGAVLGVGILSHTANYSILTKVIICWALTPIGAILFSMIFYKIMAIIFSPKLMSLPLCTGVIKLGIILAGCYGAYALGSNNVANVTGVYVGAGMMSPLTAVVVGSVSIALGAITYSKKVMYTVGKQIFPLLDFSALVVVIAEAATVHLFTQLGVPVSASQAVVGAVLGIGILKNVRALNLSRLSSILLGWIITPIASALLTILLVLFFDK